MSRAVTAPALARRIGLGGATMIVMGGIVGSGIFVTPALVARSAGSTGLILFAWLLGGLVALLGAFVYAELAAHRPDVGGQYAYLRDAYHPALAFLYGWALLVVIQTGGMAVNAIAFARHALELAPLAISESLLATGALAVLTVVNCFGVRAGSGAQSALMVLKILSLLALVGCGLLLGTRATGATASHHGAPGLLSALVPVLFSYGGWQTASFVAGEIEEPRRNLPRALLLGVAGVIALYMLVAWACVRVLGPDGLAHSGTPALEVMSGTLGRRGASLVAAGIALSTLGFLSQSILTAPRVYYAMAADGVFFAGIGRVHPRSRVPVAAIALQGALAIAIALWGGRYDEIVGYVVSVDFLFFGLVALSLFVFRRRAAAGRAPGYAMPGHPVTTLVFMFVCWSVALASLAGQPRRGLLGLGLLAAGLPGFFLWRRRKRGRP